MTEAPAKNTDLSFAGRLARTRVAVWTAMVVERGWPLILPLAVTVSLFVSLSWLGVFRIMPDMARFAATLPSRERDIPDHVFANCLAFAAFAAIFESCCRAIPRGSCWKG